MKKVLIDTDVILDFFFDRKPFADAAALLLSKCQQELIEGFVTPVIISNTYYLLRRTARHEKVIEKLRLLLKILNVLSSNETHVMQALDSSFKDFEDALQYYTALDQGNMNAIITRNVKDFRKSKIAVFTPEDFLKELCNVS